MSAAFSAIMITGALVLPLTTLRHDGGIHHAQALHAVHPQLRIHHVQRPVAHAATAHRVVDRVGVVANELFDLGVALGVDRAGQFPSAQGCQGRLVQNPAHQLEAAHQAVHVVAVAQKIGVDQGRGKRVFAGQLDAAPAARAQQAHVAGIAMAKDGHCGRGRPACRSQSAAAGRALASIGWLLMKPPASAKLVVSMPLRCWRQSKMPLMTCHMPAQGDAKQVFGAAVHSRPAPRQRGRAGAGRRRAGRAAWRCRSRAGAHARRCPTASGSAVNAARRRTAAPRGWL